MKPPCNKCKWFIKDITNLDEFGRCGLFVKKFKYRNIDVITYKNAIFARINPYLCGIDGTHYEYKINVKNTINTDTYKTEEVNEEVNKEIQKVKEEMEELEDNFNGEIYEKYEIKQLEKELKILKEKMIQLEEKINNKE